MADLTKKVPESTINNKSVINSESISSIFETNSQKVNENKKEYLMESFVNDEDLIKEYKDLIDPIKRRGKYTLIYNTILCYASFQYAKNIDIYLIKYLPKNRKINLGNLMWLSLLHCFAFSTLLIGGNCLVLGVRPIKFLKKFKEINERILEKDQNQNMTFNEFLNVVSTQIDLSSISQMPEKGASTNTNVFSKENRILKDDISNSIVDNLNKENELQKKH